MGWWQAELCKTYTLAYTLVYAKYTYLKELPRYGAGAGGQKEFTSTSPLFCGAAHVCTVVFFFGFEEIHVI